MMSSIITPLYYEKYYYDSDVEKVQIKYVVEDVDRGNNTTVKYYYYQKYSSVKNVYLKDISFTETLYNDNHLNIGENGYNPDNDNGAFFVGNHYTFDGVSTQSGKIDYMVDTLLMGIGYIDTLFFDALGYALDVVDFIQNTANFIESAKKDFREVLSNNNDYGFNMGNIVPKQGDNLLKTSGAYMQTNNTKEAILIGINNNYVSNTYYYNYSTRLNKWNSRLVSQISMDIVEEDETLTESTVRNLSTDVKTQKAYVHKLDNGYSTEIELDEDNNQIYILNNAEHKVKFIAPENGIYTINTYGNIKNLINSSSAIDIDENNQKIILDLNKGEEFFVVISKYNYEGSAFVGIEVSFTPEKIEKGLTKTITIEAGEKEYYTYNSDYIGFNYFCNSINNIELSVSQTTYYNTIYSHAGDEIFGSVVKSTGKYYIAIKNNANSPQTLELTITDVEELDINIVNSAKVMYQNAFTIELPYTLDVNLTVDYESSMFIEIFNNESVLIARTTDASNNILNFKILANQTYFIVIKNLINTTEQVVISFDKLISNLLPTFNYFNKVYEEGVLLFNNQYYSGEYYISSDVDYLVYDNQFNLLEADNDGSYIFLKGTNYYFITKENKETCNINFNIKFTNSFSGHFTASKVVFIKYVPLKTGQYNISGIESYTWYSDDLNRRYGALSANEIYYLMIEGEANTTFDIDIIYQEILRSQIPILVGVERISGNYYFTITQDGNYTFKTFRNSDNVNSTISVHSPDGTKYFSDVCTDIFLYSQYLVAGTYYLDLTTTPVNQSITIRINKSR